MNILGSLGLPMVPLSRQVWVYPLWLTPSRATVFGMAWSQGGRTTSGNAGNPKFHVNSKVHPGAIHRSSSNLYLNLNQYLRYFIMRCSKDSFDKAVIATSQLMQ